MRDPGAIWFPAINRHLLRTLFMDGNYLSVPVMICRGWANYRERQFAPIRFPDRMNGVDKFCNRRSSVTQAV